MGADGWQKRHAPANFTYAAHFAFFAGFLPTPIGPGPHPRLFAAEFPGSETTAAHTWTFPQANLVQGLQACGYRTICIGGVGFFNKKTPLGSALPALFQDSYWDESLGVTCRESTRNQLTLATALLSRLEPSQRVFLFVNVSAMHQPNCVYLPGAEADSPASQLEALAYVDSCLPLLLQALGRRGSPVRHHLQRSRNGLRRGGVYRASLESSGRGRRSLHGLPGQKVGRYPLSQQRWMH